ncbi:DNA-binding domain-containing protein [Pseudoduganella sp. OTU4001]|uniref:DNA-binding domain-containing protein n=1 Tax=Pseudoduganella sp. OTU4001 TaxID=3043854 RepID=UPI00313AA730
MNLADLQRSFHAELTAAAAAPLHDPRVALGHAVYQNNYRAALVGCLQESYPLLNAFIGEQAFLHAAATHINHHPPHAWTLDAYGDDFAHTLMALFPDNPDLHELAWIEHALGQSFVDPDAAPVAAEALAAVNWEQAKLHLTPTSHLRPATTNAADLWFALHNGEQPESEMLPAPGGLLVWRRGFTSCLRALDATEYAALSHLRHNGSFAGLCTLLVELEGEEQGIASAGAMLADWLGSELITGVENE